MKDFFVILYLWKCTLINGIRRAFTSPKRLLPLLISVCYVGYFFIRPAYVDGGLSHVSHRHHTIDPTQYPQAVNAGVFFIFVCIFVLGILSLNGYNRTLKGADIEMLFPTPISGRAVLAARILRDIAGALFFQLLFVLYFGFIFMMGSGRHFKGNQLTAIYLGGLLGWVLLSITFSIWGYVYNLYLTADEERSARNKKIFDRGVAAYVFILLAFLVGSVYFAVLEPHFTFNRLIPIADSLFLRIYCFPALLGTWLAFGFSREPFLGAIGFLGIIGLAVLAVRLCLKRMDWFYDIASSRGVTMINQRKNFLRSGFDALAVNKAKSGKLQVKRRSRFANVKVQGAPSLIWRELLITPRKLGLPILILMAVGIFYGLLPLLITFTSKRTPSSLLVASLIVGGGALGLFMFAQTQVQASGAQFLEFGDTLKALPFSSRSMMFWEISARSILPLMLIPITCIIGSIITPTFAGVEASAFVFLVPLTLVFTAVGTVSIVLFPDTGDPTQRSLRGILIMLGSVFGVAPGIGISLAFYAMFSAFQIELVFLPLLLGGVTNLAIAALLSLYAGRLYDDFLPTE